MYMSQSHEGVLGAGLASTQSFRDPVSFPLTSEGDKNKSLQKVVYETGPEVSYSLLLTFHWPELNHWVGLHLSAKEAGKSIYLGAQEDKGNSC